MRRTMRPSQQRRTELGPPRSRRLALTACRPRAPVPARSSARRAISRAPTSTLRPKLNTHSSRRAALRARRSAAPRKQLGHVAGRLPHPVERQHGAELPADAHLHRLEPQLRVVRVPHAGRDVDEEYRLAEPQRVLDRHGRPVTDEDVGLEQRVALRHPVDVAKARVRPEPRDQTVDQRAAPAAPSGSAAAGSRGCRRPAARRSAAHRRRAGSIARPTSARAGRWRGAGSRPAAAAASTRRSSRG